MRRVGSLSVLPVVAVCLSGCAGRELRSSTQCEWRSEPAVSLDLKNPAHQQHLRDDAQAAEALAVRYADSKDGLAQFGQHRQVTEQCEATLFSSIARVHHVAPEQIRAALRRQNDIPR